MSDTNNFDTIKDKVLAMLKISPKMTHELAKQCGYNSANTFRASYLSKIETLGLIEKISGSNRWMIKGQKATNNKVAEMLTTEDGFYDTEVIKNWRENNNAKSREDFIVTFKGICMGTLTRKDNPNAKLDFKINPDAWQHDYDTKRCIKALKEFSGSDELGYSYRMTLRNALQYGMNISLTQAKSETLGISGKTDKPTISTMHMKDDIFEAILDDDTVQLRQKMLFFFSYCTFFRTSTRYTVKIENIEFYNREQQSIILKNGKQSTKLDVIESLNGDDPEKYPITTLKHRAAMVHDTQEFKTEKSFVKYVWHEKFVDQFEKYVESRKHQGYKYLFWDNNDTVFTKDNYRDTVAYSRKVDNKYFLELFNRYGFKNTDFAKDSDANYAIRHFGVQRWLVATNYNYGQIMIMGWDDINTLIKWYGQRPMHQVQKDFSEVRF